GAGVNCVDLGVVASAQPEYPSVRGDAAHVRARGAEVPGVHDTTSSEANDRDRPGDPVRDVEKTGVAAGVETVGAGAGRQEPDQSESFWVDFPQSTAILVGDVQHFAVRRELDVLGAGGFGPQVEGVDHSPLPEIDLDHRTQVLAAGIHVTAVGGEIRVVDPGTA